jgi:transcriptional regulator with XRE-family HTH domain
VRGYREKLGWTQEKLAVRINTAPNYIGCIERAEKKPSIDTLVKIAKVLKIDPSHFLVKDSYKNE